MSNPPLESDNHPYAQNSHYALWRWMEWERRRQGLEKEEYPGRHRVEEPAGTPVPLVRQAERVARRPLSTRGSGELPNLRAAFYRRGHCFFQHQTP